MNLIRWSQAFFIKTIFCMNQKQHQIKVLLVVHLFRSALKKQLGFICHFAELHDLKSSVND